MPNILAFNTDDEIVLELGNRLRTIRLQRNLTVAEVATKAGINRNTVLNAERGKNPRLNTVVKLLRVYERLESLNGFIEPPSISPLQLVRTKGQLRQRARKSRHG